jgi:hypothetical protein
MAVQQGAHLLFTMPVHLAHQTAAKTHVTSSASRSASRRFQPIGTSSSGTNGGGARSSSWFAPSLPPSPISSFPRRCARPTALECGFRASQRARTPRAYDQRRKIPGAFEGSGYLDIGWWTVGKTFTMRWAERDGPPVSAPQRRGFGTIVMQEMAKRSVNGRVNLEYASSGLAWRLTCPAVRRRSLKAEAPIGCSPKCPKQLDGYAR